MIAQPLRAVRAVAGIVVLAWLAGCAASGASVPRAPAEPAPAAVAGGADIGSRAARIALEQVGVPYRYGGTGPSGFDCSGLVHYAYLNAGKVVPRTSRQLWSGTAAVARHELRPGDVLFFEIEGKMQHVGLYVGGDRFVHAPATGRTVSVGSLASAFYEQAYLRAGRPR
jgi:cell wall-associated NlpC family hydrolase